MHPFPATHPFPVAGIALIAHNEFSRTPVFLVRHQRGKDGRDVRKMRLPFLFGFRHRETFFHEARIVLPAHKAVGIHHGLVKGYIRANTDDAIFFQGAPHTQDGLPAGLAPHDELGNHRIVKRCDLKTDIYSRINPYTGTGWQADCG